MTTPAGPAAYVTPLDITSWPAAEPLYLGAGGLGGVVTTLPCILMGWSVHETTGAAAGHVYLVTGGDATGQRVAETVLAQGASYTQAIPPPGVLCQAGLYADVGGTAVHGVAWVVLLTQPG